jgi:hypothetical protein
MQPHRFLPRFRERRHSSRDGVDSLMPMLQQWKKAARIRYLGVTTSRVSQHADMIEAMRRYPLDFIGQAARHLAPRRDLIKSSSWEQIASGCAFEEHRGTDLRPVLEC